MSAGRYSKRVVEEGTLKTDPPDTIREPDPLSHEERREVKRMRSSSSPWVKVLIVLGSAAIGSIPSTVVALKRPSMDVASLQADIDKLSVENAAFRQEIRGLVTALGEDQRRDRDKFSTGIADLRDNRRDDLALLREVDRRVTDLERRP